MLGGIIIIVGIIIFGELSSLFKKSIRSKLPESAYKKYRFAILTAELFLYSLGIFASFVIGGVINGENLISILPGVLKYTAVLFLGSVIFAGLCLLVKRLISVKKEKS